MKIVTVNGKKAYARVEGKLMTIYSSLIDYVLDIPDPYLMHIYSRENGLETVLDRLLRKLRDRR